MALPRAWPHGVIGALLLAAISASPRDAAAQDPAAIEPPATPQAPAPAIEPASDPAKELARLSGSPDVTLHWMGSLFFGDGLRFNNPYRLKTQIGTSAKTVSVTAPYVDLGAGLALGDAFGLQHGMSINLSVALDGVGQAVVVPSYLAVYRGASSRLIAFGRFGPAIIASPDANIGAELGVGGAIFVTSKLAVTGEIVGDLFYGAATRETGYPVYPIVSLQLGVLFDHEVLP